ncbi:hypothetical protein [Nocardioides sp. InS609-2]|uniref:hypothetical protein n=1 Tax=Nocardioides sp. InS609-2 TaxID=2760705 RepID=UPI001791C1D1|nr:hypothetical protein [Nocardioides sp. InS609-2]MBA3783158.1 hypothetical protein [Nocardioides sp.]
MTLGIAAPACLAGLIAKAKSIIEKCRTFMKALASSLDKMAALLGKISPAMESATKTLSKYVVEGASLPVETALDFGFSMGKGATGINNP